MLYLDNKEFVKAVESFDKAIAVIYDHPLYHCNKGSAFLANNDNTKADKCFQEARVLLDSNKLVGGINQESKDFIRKTLDKYLEQVEKLKTNTFEKRRSFYDQQGSSIAY